MKLHFVFSFDSNNKLSDPIVGSLVRNGSRVFDDFIVGVKSYMEVSSQSLLEEVQISGLGIVH